MKQGNKTYRIAIVEDERPCAETLQNYPLLDFISDHAPKYLLKAPSASYNGIRQKYIDVLRDMERSITAVKAR